MRQQWLFLCRDDKTLYGCVLHVDLQFYFVLIKSFLNYLFVTPVYVHLCHLLNLMHVITITRLFQNTFNVCKQISYLDLFRITEMKSMFKQTQTSTPFTKG